MTPRPWSLADAILVFLLAQGFTLGAGALIAGALRPAGDLVRVDKALMVWIGLLQPAVIGMLVLLVAGRTRAGRRTLSGLLDWRPLAPIARAGLAGGLGIKVLSDVVVLVEQQFVSVESNNPFLTRPWLHEPSLEQAAIILSLVVLVPVAEELLYRGLVYTALRARLAAPAAIVASAAFFAAVHLNPTLLPSLFLVGAGLAWLMERTGSLWPPIIAHVFINGVAVLGSLLVGPG